MRKALKAMGYQVRVRSMSEFSDASVLKNGKRINGGNVLTKDHLEEHQQFYDWKNSHSVIDDGWRTII